MQISERDGPFERVRRQGTSALRRGRGNAADKAVSPEIWTSYDFQTVVSSAFSRFGSTFLRRQDYRGSEYGLGIE